MRNIRKTIRFSDDEYSKIDLQLQKANIDFASFCRKSLLKTKIILPIEKDLLFELNKIGNNLNQIARAVNKKEKIQVLTKLIEIEKQLKEITK